VSISASAVDRTGTRVWVDGRVMELVHASGDLKQLWNCGLGSGFSTSALMLPLGASQDLSERKTKNSHFLRKSFNFKMYYFLLISLF